jgi:hypothetical protein
MRSTAALLLVLGLVLPVHCGAPSPRSPHSFDEIQQIVAGKTASEVEALLGRPDARRQLITEDEKWTWWNYTVLDGEQYAPEVRGEIVHLEIVFEDPSSAGAAALPRTEWRVSGPFAVSYSRPSISR